MNQLSKHTILGLFFLFLGAIELIGCGIIEGMQFYTVITDFLAFFVVLHLVLGYGFLVARFFIVKNQTPTLLNTKDQL